MANMDSKMSELSGNIQGMNDKMSEGFQSLSQSLLEGGGSGNDEDEWEELDEEDNLINDLFSDS